MAAETREAKSNAQFTNRFMNLIMNFWTSQQTCKISESSSDTLVSVPDWPYGRTGICRGHQAFGGPVLLGTPCFWGPRAFGGNTLLAVLHFCHTKFTSKWQQNGAIKCIIWSVLWTWLNLHSNCSCNVILFEKQNGFSLDRGDIFSPIFSLILVHSWRRQPKRK